MDTQYLRTFILLSELNNFTQTADQMFVAQSTVTNRIAELEKEIGKKLFHRDRKSITLTDEGKLFLNYAKRIVELEESSIQEINSLNLYHDKLRIGTTNTIYECHLSHVIRSFLKNTDNISVKVTIDHSANLLQMLQDGLLDIIYSYVPLQRNGYHCTCFTTDELALVTSPLSKSYSLGIKQEELAQINYLFCNFALQEVGIFIRELFPPFYQFSFEIDNSTKLIQYLLDGIGYSFLPKSLVIPYLENGSLISISLLDFETPKINCYRAYKNDNKIISEFLKL